MACIVVLDDEPDIRALLGEILEAEGYQVILLQHPAQLTSALLEVEPSLFLLDLMLQRTTGIEVARELRAARFAEVPMIAMSASVLMAHMAQHSGVFHAVLRKPFELDELCAAVGRCLSANPAARRSELEESTGHVRGHALRERLALGDAC